MNEAKKVNAQETPNTKKCPFCAETIKIEAMKCRFCGSYLDKKRYVQGWMRSRKYGKLAGVCAGLAQQLAIPVLFIRLTFIILTFIGGWGLVIYLALWMLMPVDEDSIKHREHYSLEHENHL